MSEEDEKWALKGDSELGQDEKRKSLCFCFVTSNSTELGLTAQSRRNGRKKSCCQGHLYNRYTKGKAWAQVY